MKKFSKDDISRLGTTGQTLTSAWSDVADCKNAVDDAVAEMNAAIERYNEAMEEARGFVEDLANIANEYMGERSEKWQEGEAGQAYQEWIFALENVDFSEVEEVKVEYPDEPDHADQLEQLPTEPEQY